MVLPWPTEEVSVGDHGTLCLLVQRLPGWKSSWRVPLLQGSNGKFMAWLYHADALPHFARAAEVIALVRHRGTPEEAKNRLVALSVDLRTNNGSGR